MLIRETRVFTRQIAELLSDDEYRELQAALAERPETGALIPGSGELRKVRWAPHGRGKSGGVRAIYYRQVSADVLLMLYAYPKNEMENLTRAQVAALRKIIEEEGP